MKKSIYAYFLAGAACLAVLALVFVASVPVQTPSASAAQASATPEKASGAPKESDTLDISPLEVLGWLAIPLVAFVAYRIYRLYRLTNRNSQLVVAEFGNSSGVASLDKMMAGVSQLARQKLIEEMENLRRKVELSRLSNIELLEKASLPTGVTDTKLTSLITAVAETVPKEVQPVVQLIGLLTSPRGTRVNSYLQLTGDTPGKAGISFEILDIESVREPESFTIWEEPLNDGPALAANGTPGGVDEAALALYELGLLYEARGALEQAKSMYEESLKKEPAYPAATEALGRVLLSERRTLSERYIALMEPAILWLSTRLSKRTMLEDVFRHHYREIDLQRRREGSPPVPPDQREEEVRWASRGDRARVYNFIGAYYIYRASSHGAIYELALSTFAQAAELAPNWYLIYENIGDVYSYIDRQPQAILNYDKALALTEYTDDSSQSIEANCRIRISKGIAQLQSDESVLIEGAIGAIGGIEAECLDVPVPNTRLLYDLACWYAIAARKGVGDDDAMSTARRYLAATLARDREREF